MELRGKEDVRVVIFKHPRAQESLSLQVAELAMQADLTVEYDTRVVPFVPNYGGPTGAAMKFEEGASPEPDTTTQ
jgi:hypothetical protein